MKTIAHIFSFLNWVSILCRTQMIYLIYCIFITFSLNFFWAHINLMKIQFTFVRPRCVATPFAERRRPYTGYLNTCAYTIRLYVSVCNTFVYRTLLTIYVKWKFYKRIFLCAGLSFEIFFLFCSSFSFLSFSCGCTEWGDYNTAQSFIYVSVGRICGNRSSMRSYVMCVIMCTVGVYMLECRGHAHVYR